MSSITADLSQIPMKTRFLSLLVAVCAAALAASAPAIGVLHGGSAPSTTVESLLGDRDGLASAYSASYPTHQCGCGGRAATSGWIRSRGYCAPRLVYRCISSARDLTPSLR